MTLKLQIHLINSKLILNAMSEKKRYTDEELQEFKELILKKLELAKNDYQQMMDTLSNKAGNDVDDTMPTYKVLEEGSLNQTKEELTTMAARQQKFILFALKIRLMAFVVSQENSFLRNVFALCLMPHLVSRLSRLDKCELPFSCGLI